MLTQIMIEENDKRCICIIGASPGDGCSGLSSQESLNEKFSLLVFKGLTIPDILRHMEGILIVIASGRG